MAMRDFGSVEQATRVGQKARIALSGLSGSGKTMTALQVARVITDDGNVLVLDTENKSAGLYAGQFGEWTYDVYNWEPKFDPRQLQDALDHFEGQYDAIIVDSFSAFWSGEGGLLEIADAAGKGKGPGAGWKVATPIQESLIQKVLRSDCHVILNMRTKSGIEIGKDDKGKVEVKKLATKLVQREETIYEMTIAGTIDVDDHSLKIEKSRLSEVADQVYKPGRGTIEFATKLRAWLNSAEAEVETAKMIDSVESTFESTAQEAETIDLSNEPITNGQVEEIMDLVGQLPEETSDEVKSRFTELFSVTHPNQLTGSQFDQARDLFAAAIA